MKRLLAMVLCVCLALGAPCALAAAGDKVILKSGSGEFTNVGVYSLAYLDGTVYLLDAEWLFTYDGELRSHAYKAPAQTEGAETNVTAIMTDENALYALTTEYIRTAESYDFAGITLYNLSVEPDGTVAFKNPISLDKYAFIDIEDEYEYVREMDNPFIQDGSMVFVTYTDFGRVVMTYDLSTHYVNELYVENVNSVSPYKPGKLLAVTRDYEKETYAASFIELDVASGDTENLFTISAVDYNLPEGIVYDARSNSVYYHVNGELIRIEDMRPETAMNVNAMPVKAYYMRPVLTDDGFYVAGDYGTVVMCNTDPNARAERRLVVQNNYNSAIDKAFFNFTEAHGDVEVRLTDIGGDPVNAMLTRDDSVDIYFMHANQSAYASMYARGYLAELTGSEKLKAYVSDMYPAFRNAIEKDGELYALPVELESYNNLGVYSKQMRELGLTADDLPKTWLEFIDFIKGYPALAEAHPEISLFGNYTRRADIARILYLNFWRSYLQYMLKNPSADISFDTPIFRDVLKGLSEIDYEALGVPEEYPQNDGWGTVASNSLLAMYADIGIDLNTYEFYTPMPLAFSEGEDPIIRATLSLLVVNPYSKNRELAIEFLESVADSVSASMLTQLNMHMDEPLLNEYYDQNIESMLDYVETLQAAMEKADEAEKLAFQERIDEQLISIDEYRIKHKYSATAESIANYRGYAIYMSPDGNSSMDDESAVEINALNEQYLSGAIDMDALIKALDSKLRLMLLEGV